MGEVWLARDLKLQVELALKVVRPDRLGDEGALARLRAEVLAARAVASPHVCRVYDLVEAEGLECVSMEYVDGTTLRHVLDTRTPLELSEARQIGLQLLAGLGAIHEAGLVHRDVKPENIMLTRTGRVVLMDFGVAKAAASGGEVAGTPAYWAPEQARGAPPDPRADVFAAALVLAEMVAPSGVREYGQRLALGQALREDPPRVPETPWSEAIRKAVAREPGGRYPSARALARALEEIAHRVTGVEEAHPYPGLSAFTEGDAEYFFGREAEVEEVWKRLPQRHLLALVGPSGAGKSSFLMAGLIPAKPEGWSHLVCTPGDAPFVALGQALVPEVSRGTDAMRQMLRFEDADVAVELFRRWRSGQAEALVIVDQFEELFTLNLPEVQARFASLLSRLVLEADVHVLLAMRDDFLFRCQEYEALRPVFSDLMPLGPPAGEALRRALVQPALKCGYRFEDETLVTKMHRAVEGERGALPLLAFAAASLWEKRDRENGLLTHAAYEAIGGVGGALAQHAEATLDRIGPNGLSHARELFRNLVTAEGTRAVCDVDELLTVFPEADRADAEAVLRTLIDARLLTTYEAHATEPGERAGRRVEIVHESLLTAWPRLVRWQTQDADGAQLRDQLRQAAHLWGEKGKPEDLLWTGTSYQEYQLWRERYPGKLSSLEEAFAGSMASLLERKRRRRRAAVGSILVALVVVAGVMAVLWTRADTQRTRAEASKLLAMAQLEVETDPTAALAYATKSLELDDTRAARFFALRLMQTAPVASVAAEGVSHPWFSPDGEWLAMEHDGKIHLVGQDGRRPAPFAIPGEPPGGGFLGLAFGPDSRVVSVLFRDQLRMLSVPDGREVKHVKYPEAADGWCPHCGLATRREGNRWTFFVRPLDGEEQRLIGKLELSEPLGDVSPTRDFNLMAYAVGRKIYLRSPDQWELPPRLLGEHPTNVQAVELSKNGQRLIAMDRSGEIRIWDSASTSGRPLRVFETPALKGPAGFSYCVGISPAEGWLLADTGGEGHAFIRIWDLTAPPGAGPLLVRTKAGSFSSGWAEEPRDRGFAAVDDSDRLIFWTLPRPQPRVFDWHGGKILSVAFTADGATLVAARSDGDLRAWPLSAEASAAFRTLPKANGLPRIAAAPNRREIIVGSVRGRVQVIPVDGGEPQELAGYPTNQQARTVAFSPDGRRVAAATNFGPAKGKKIYVWDLETGAVQVLEPVPGSNDQLKGGFWSISFVDKDQIAATVHGSGLMLFDVRDGKRKVLSREITHDFALGRSGKVGVGLAWDWNNPLREIFRFGLDGSAPVPLPYRAEGGGRLALDPSGTVIASTGPEDTIQVGPISGGEPHLLFGHKGDVNSLAFSPDGKWLASAGNDQTVRVWPVPDVNQVPPHKRSHREFLATLRTFTNLRAVPDPKSPNGWKLEPGPFPGWKTFPHW
jgi:WD40 repeat protein